MDLKLAEKIFIKTLDKLEGTKSDLKYFLNIIEFLNEHPELIPKTAKKHFADTPIFYTKLSDKFLKAKHNRIEPTIRKTIPDEMIDFIIEISFLQPKSKMMEIKNNYAITKAAESTIGHLLERYIDLSLKKYGWVWCSGNIVKSVDFIKKIKDGSWLALQVKNRDNTENSSSKSVRAGTKILIWFRSFSKPKKKNWKTTNWDAFPDEQVRHQLSEEGFRIFIKDYLSKLKNNQ